MEITADPGGASRYRRRIESTMVWSQRAGETVCLLSCGHEITVIGDPTLLWDDGVICDQCKVAGGNGVPAIPR
jgi:hypothetical protein